MDIELWKTLAELGIGGVALFMFYKLITKQNEDHREDRQRDAKIWRSEIKEGRHNTDVVLKELTNVIKEINEINRQNKVPSDVVSNDS